MVIERRDGYRLWIDGPVAGAAATTIGHTILIRRAHLGNERLLRHEQEHVVQYDRYGFVGNFLRYLAVPSRESISASFDL